MCKVFLNSFPKNLPNPLFVFSFCFQISFEIKKRTTLFSLLPPSLNLFLIMFKKPFKTKNSFVFRKSDKKKWLAKLERFFGEEMVAQLLDLSQDVEVHSIANSRNSIFTQNKEPIFFCNTCNKSKIDFAIRSR